MMDYNYPLDYTWSTEDIIDVMSLYNAVEKAYEEGIKLVLKQLKDVLAYNGVKEIETVGKEFDPELHEAVSHVTDEKLGKNIIKEEFRKGYIIGTKVIRHSMVIVAN